MATNGMNSTLETNARKHLYLISRPKGSKGLQKEKLPDAARRKVNLWESECFWTKVLWRKSAGDSRTDSTAGNDLARAKNLIIFDADG